MSIIVDMIAKSVMNSKSGELQAMLPVKYYTGRYSDLKTVHRNVKLEVDKCATIKNVLDII